MLGEQAPDFTATALVDYQFEDVTLSTYRGKYVVLFFYPADFTFVCPTELISFSDRIAEFKKIDCEVIGVSCDTHFVHLAWWVLNSLADSCTVLCEIFWFLTIWKIILFQGANSTQNGRTRRDQVSVGG